jgi:hypothetical protein
MPGSYTCRRLPAYFWTAIPLWAGLMALRVRKGQRGEVAFWAVFLLVTIWVTRIRVRADDAGMLVVGLLRARRFSWDQIESISRAFGPPHYRRSEGLMAGFRTLADGAPRLLLRDGRSVRLLAIHKDLGKRVEDPVVRLSAMLQDYRRRGGVDPRP